MTPENLNRSCNRKVLTRGMFTQILCAVRMAQVSFSALQKHNEPLSLKISGLTPLNTFLGYLLQKRISY